MQPRSESDPLFHLPQEGCGPSCWRPAVDVYRGSRGWLVKVELAGVPEEEVEVTLRGRWLRIAGERRDTQVREGRRAWSMEIAYSRFERALELPVEFEGARLRCESRHGMLLIAVEEPEGAS